MAEVDDLINQPSEGEKRIKDLSGKVRETAEERDKALAQAEEAAKKADAAERKAQFLEGYSDLVAENPAAKEFKADIEAKVMGGMSLEDAKFVVLGKAGKLATPPAPAPSPIGGSANTALPSNGTAKSVSEMSTDEKRAALVEMERRGDISWTQ